MPTNILTTLTAGHEISRQRMESLTIAAELGADEATLITPRDALRVRRHPTMVLPRERLENLSRGRGWCRQGKGDNAVWGERHERGYEVGPGKWTVGGHDGFSRKGYDAWTVRQIQVGDQTWTVAD